MYCKVKCVLFSYSCIWYANWCGLIPLQVLLCEEPGVKKCNPCGFRLEKLHQFSIPLKSMFVFFWEFVLCSNLRFNLFIITTFGSNSIVWLACGIQLCQIQSVHGGNNIWKMMCELRPEISFIWHLVASFWQQFFWFPLYIWSKNYLHFHISCPNNKTQVLQVSQQVNRSTRQ